MSIKTKLISIISLTIFIIVGTTTALLIRFQNDSMVKTKLRDTEFLCDIIERTIYNAMKDGNTEEVRKILENIGKNREIISLRILSPEGLILKSAKGTEVGGKATDFIKSAASINSQPAFISDTTISHFRAISNRADCYGCHDSSRQVIGIIQIKHDVSRNVITFLSLKRLLIASSIAIVLIVSLVLGILFSRLVMRPLNSLLSTIRDIEGGNLHASVRISANDELGVIGLAFNNMVREMNSLFTRNIAKERELSRMKVELDHRSKVEDLNEQLEFKIKELQTANRAISTLSREVKGKNIDLERAIERLKRINDIGQMLTSIIETKELIKIVIRTTADLLQAEKITLQLKKADKPVVTIRHIRGSGTENLDTAAFEAGVEILEVLTHGRQLVIRMDSHDNGGNGSRESRRASVIGVPLAMKGQIIGAMILENSVDGFSDDDLELLMTLANQAMVAIENAWLYENVKNSYFSTIQSLVNALEANDRFTKGHSERVRMLAVELARHAGLDHREIELLEHASILHDIGKIGIDSFILQKQGRLTSKEYSLVKAHPLIGNEILGPIETLDAVRKTIIQHHERYDGGGYPYGLKGEEISLKSKILSVVDTFDAMMTDRPYRKALSLEQVITELKLNSGTQFDPYVVEAFLDLLSIRGEQILESAGYSFLYSPI